MATYLISYDLNKPNQNYQGLIDKIQALGGGWWHHLDSTWIIRNAGTAESIRNALMPLIDNNDELLVVQLTRNAAWVGFNQAGSNWLQSNL